MTKQNILLVDDDPTIPEIIKKTLEDHGYTSIASNDGKECLDLINQQHNQIDAVILDIMMPEMDGRQTLKAIRKHKSAEELPVLMLTGENQLSDLSECLKLGANDYMLKPFEPSLLIFRLQKILLPREFEENKTTLRTV